MSDYSRVITSIVEIEPLFAVIEKFFANSRYAVVRNEFPDKIEFRKKGSFFAVHDINTTYILIVNFFYLNNKSVIKLNYSFPQCAGSLSSKSVLQLNEEVDRLTAKVDRACQKFHTYRVEQGKTPKPFSYCPYCGTELNLPKTPASCPHCTEPFPV